MKTKPMWGLWLLMIVAPVAMFVGVNYWKNLPPRLQAPIATPSTYLPSALSIAQSEEQVLPYFEKAEFQQSKSSQDAYTVRQLYRMPGKTREYRFVIRVIDGETELKYKYKYKYKTSSHIFNDAGNGPVEAAYNIDVKKRRTQDILLKVTWELNEKHGIKIIAIKPQN